MRFYTATAFLFPRHYERRFTAICLFALLLPLAACITLQAMTGQWHEPTLAALLGATMLGSIVVSAAMRALLTPIAHTADMLEAIRDGEPVTRIPAGNDDLVGRLLRSVTAVANESAMRTERRLEAAERDPLTNIRNRHGFLESIRNILCGGDTSVLALVEIDHFALIVDHFGETQSDAVITAVAKRLEDGLRRTDIVARWDGVQFTILLTDTLLDEARAIMERLRTSFALDESLGGQGWPVTFSCGLAPIRTYAEFSDALRQADSALDAAKSKGRNRVLALTA
jgi:diguanylate cyclase (GGDEF)-like protein